MSAAAYRQTPHLVDAAFRKRTSRNRNPNQKALAARIGRSPSWMKRKYLHRRRAATIDDVLRLVAITILEFEPPLRLTPAQRTLLDQFAAMGTAGRKAVQRFAASYCPDEAPPRT